MSDESGNGRGAGGGGRRGAGGASRGGDGGEGGGEADGGSGRRWLAAGLCAGILALGALGHVAIGWIAGEPEPREPGPTGPLVEVAPVARVETLTVAQTGFVRPAARLTLSAEVDGRVARVSERFRVGRRIEAGETLVELAPERFEAELAAAEARLAGARARADAARSNVERQRRLDDDGYAVDQRLEEVETALASAEAEAALAASRTELARIALDDVRIRAPYDAVVTARDVSLGQIVGPGTGVGELVAAARAEIRVGLVPRQRALLDPDDALVGRPVDVFAVAGDGRRLATGRIAAVDPAIDPAARTLGLVVDVDDPFAGGALRVGELVEVVVPVPRTAASVFDVPARALKGADRLWVVEGGTLRAVDPRVVRRGDDRVQVASDALGEGDRVLLTDVAAAVEGLEVRVAEPEDGGDGGRDGGGRGEGGNGGDGARGNAPDGATAAGGSGADGSSS